VIRVIRGSWPFAAFGRLPGPREAACAPPQPHLQREVLNSSKRVSLPGWDGHFLALKPSLTAVSRFRFHEEKLPAETQRCGGGRCSWLRSPRLSGSAGDSPPAPWHGCRPRALTRREGCRTFVRRVRAPGLQAESPAETQRRRDAEMGGGPGSGLRGSAALRAILLQPLGVAVGRAPSRGGKDAAPSCAG